MYCKNCGTPIDTSTSYCPACGYYQGTTPVDTTKQNKPIPAIIITLCVFTILGSATGIIRGLFYETIAAIGSNSEYWRGYAFVIVNIGTLIAAILMLSRKAIGFTIYVIFQVAYVVLVLYTTLFYTDSGIFGGTTADNSVTAFALFISSLFLIPSIIMLILFLVFGRKQMK